MNILPHKSWHVYNKKNIEKVRKDEEKAKEEERSKQARITLAESEARLAILRKRAEERELITSTDSQPVVKYEHVNLFEDLKTSTTNEERDAEEKEKNDKWERQITMYLDKDKDDKPWYAGSKSSDDKYRDVHVKKFQYKDDHHKKRKRDPIDLKDDPLALVNSLLKDKEKNKRSDHHRHHHHRSRKDTKEHKRTSKEHKDTRKSSSSNTSSSSSKKSSSIETLRAQRLERERQERQRVNELILGHSPSNEEEQESKGYHSQFNPNETREAKAKYQRRY